MLLAPCRTGSAYAGELFQFETEALRNVLPYCSGTVRKALRPTTKERMMATSFTLNGKKVTANSEPDTPLLWVIRDEIGLTGTKFGCGAQLCGACTVHLDGVPIRSCQTPLSAAAGQKVATIESLSKDNSHPLQKAWLAHDVPQCGYCQSGQLMSAAALLAKNKNPSDADIDNAMSGNICRCGTYNRMRAAIHDAAAEMRTKA
jgi:isoquinoline 1-oxidoreductase alpha subunit